MATNSAVRKPPRPPAGDYCNMFHLTRFLADEDGTTAVEYAVMLALIIAVCITGIASVGSTNNGSLKDSMDKLGVIMGS